MHSSLTHPAVFQHKNNFHLFMINWFESQLKPCIDLQIAGIKSINTTSTYENS